MANNKMSKVKTKTLAQNFTSGEEITSMINKLTGFTKSQEAEIDYQGECAKTWGNEISNLESYIEGLDNATHASRIEALKQLLEQAKPQLSSHLKKLSEIEKSVEEAETKKDELIDLDRRYKHEKFREELNSRNKSLAISNPVAPKFEESTLETSKLKKEIKILGYSVDALIEIGGEK